MEPITRVQYIQGDFTDEAVINRIDQLLDCRGADLVLSDMAPNITGNRSVDQPRTVALAEAVLNALEKLLRPGGGLVLKTFQGEGFEDLVRQARRVFGTVRILKPGASRAESREMYLVAGNYRL